jgi:hypothetical protein
MGGNVGDRTRAGLRVVTELTRHWFRHRLATEVIGYPGDIGFRKTGAARRSFHSTVLKSLNFLPWPFAVT